jgi:serine/threonine protein kinase
MKIGRYQLVERIGAGGVAEVWRAHSSDGQSPVALKRILPAHLDAPAAVEALLQEGRMVARLHHPNIVQVIAFGSDGGESFIAMELIDGIDVTRLLRGLSEPPPPGLGAYVMSRVCRALSYAHRLTDEAGLPLGIVHRDVSPSNIFLGRQGVVKLGDFGIAKALYRFEVPRTRTGELKGKPWYLAPEQIAGQPLDHRLDQFACGVVLHEMLAGRRLFKAERVEDTLAQILECNVEPPSRANPEVPQILDEICLRALARDPARRFGDCDEMAAALDPVVRMLDWDASRLAALLRKQQPRAAQPNHGRALSWLADAAVLALASWGLYSPTTPPAVRVVKIAAPVADLEGPGELPLRVAAPTPASSREPHLPARRHGVSRPNAPARAPQRPRLDERMLGTDIHDPFPTGANK